MNNIIGLLGHAGSGKDTVADFLVTNYGFIKMSLADEMKRFARRVFEFTDEQLWGPSSCRNAVDHRYDNLQAWNEANINLIRHGRDWVKFLFPTVVDDFGFGLLLQWFEDLSEKFGGHTGGAANQLSPRVVLQTLGTEFGRAIDEQVWIRATTTTAERVLSGDYRYTRETGCTPITCSVEPPRGVVISDCRFDNEVSGVRSVGGRVVRVKRPGMEKGTIGIAGHASEAEQDTIPDSAFDYVLASPEGLENLYAELNAVLPLFLSGRL